MSRSTARLKAVEVAGSTRIARALAEAPQRWTVGRAASDGWAEVTHQLLGDGNLGGDTHCTTIEAGCGARLVARGIAPTPLRAGSDSLAVVRLRVAAGSSLVYLPGALVPHAGSRHSNVLDVQVAAAGSALCASILVPGRVAMGEHGGFERLRLRTTLRVGGALAFCEDAEVSPEGLGSLAGFAGAGAYVSIFATGSGQFAGLAARPGRVAFSRLREGAMACRALFANLGEAQAFVGGVEAEWRKTGCRSAILECFPSEQAAPR